MNEVAKKPRTWEGACMDPAAICLGWDRAPKDQDIQAACHHFQDIQAACYHFDSLFSVRLSSRVIAGMQCGIA